ncbi:MAG TPA: sigma-54-dependent Fis family transcriptional regulator [Pirellulales bacterium]|jgi:Nif-specific regulatory protein|nr:sigma-54-dependent Fis family transcriptional regulator [Pirellulales bacterium]
MPLALELFTAANKAAEPDAWLAAALPLIASELGADFAAAAVADAGRLYARVESGPARALPGDLLAEVLDREAVRADGNWAAGPLAPRAAQAEALVLHFPQSVAADVAAAIESLLPLVREVLELVRARHQQARHVRRLEAVLEIAQQWNQTREIEPLLVQMAEAATRLFHCDRASIFLWDRQNRLLIGRPALGVKGGELRVADDRGVVGRVLQSGQPMRVDDATQPDVIDHQIGAQLRYRTRTLLCVPMQSRSGERLGVFELLNKTSGKFTQDEEIELTELAAHAAVALENVQDRQRLLATNRQLVDQAAEGVRLIGDCPAIESLRSIVGRVAQTDLAVLVGGENGTGKEVVAQSIHYQSRRRGQPFIALNCAAIPESLAESELFGHEKGAFTDAREARPGKFELASGGTLFLDEIGDLSLNCQAKLLRVLEEKVMVRVGGSVPIPSDARVLAATNQNLAEMVRDKRFREDLYFRLNIVTIDLPPLRERGGDILLLAEHFLRDFCRRARRAPPDLTSAARKRLTEHPWPGNVRELRNLMERLAYLTTGDRIEAEDLAFILLPRRETESVADLGHSLADATTNFQSDYIRRTIKQLGGNMSRVAEQLGLHRSNLYRKMSQLGMQVPDKK